uniref:Cytochrome c oxidase subunit 3 n=1 Tax=Gonepteryx rhamni TaxID=78609 RepID=A0A0A6ZC37_GONRH|nr:cytochrome c oxidase subunit III [Gonepteryx rhamni]AGG39572.1 cytochrome c oxidase subunit III [Gonepteryx rhamni]
MNQMTGRIYKEAKVLAAYSLWSFLEAPSKTSLSPRVGGGSHYFSLHPVTWAHHAMMMMIFHKPLKVYLLLFYQGKFYFSILQAYEYMEASFTISETFFMVPCLHVIIGTIFLLNVLSVIIWSFLEITILDLKQIPLLNTIILITSGLTVTWAHHAMMNNNFSQTSQSLFITILLGFYFSILQAYEYMEASFTISDSVHGSTFFMATGFHGLHVIIGTIFLLTCFIRHSSNHFSSNHHFGFEAAAWYWHFVDVVWLFLYISIYWWGN